jgi:hypothetical protein
MPVRLNITMDADLYERLKRELPAKPISRFINDAVRAASRSTYVGRRIQGCAQGGMAQGAGGGLGRH